MEATLCGYKSDHFLRWALENDAVPTTLIGRSHGDLHGRNVLVGVQRGEVEQPALFDYEALSRLGRIYKDAGDESGNALLLPLAHDVASLADHEALAGNTARRGTTTRRSTPAWCLMTSCRNPKKYTTAKPPAKSSQSVMTPFPVASVGTASGTGALRKVEYTRRETSHSFKEPF